MIAIFSFSRSCRFWNSFSGLYGFGTKGFVLPGRPSKNEKLGFAGAGGTSSFRSCSASASPATPRRSRGLSRGTHSSCSWDQVLKAIFTLSALSSLTRAAHQPPDHSTLNIIMPTLRSSGLGLAVSGSLLMGKMCFKLAYCCDAVKGCDPGEGGGGIEDDGGKVDGGAGTAKPWASTGGGRPGI